MNTQLTNAKKPEKLALVNRRPSRPCSASDLTWRGLDGQCLNCGAVSGGTLSVRHVLTARQAEDRYVFGLGGGSARLRVFVDAQGREI